MDMSLLSSNDEENRLAPLCEPEGECSAETRPPKPEKAKRDGERRCIVSGETGPREGLIRFVVGPADEIIPDLAEKLPGRGFWTTSSRDIIEQAISRNFFKRAARKPVRVAADLADQIEKLLARRCLELLGLARGAGLVVVGQSGVEEEWGKGTLSYLLAASDAGGDGLKKLSRSDIQRSGFTRAELGAALGRDHAVYLGLKPSPLSDKFRAEISRWTGFCLPRETQQQDIKQAE